MASAVSGMAVVLDELAGAASFLRALPGTLRRPLTPAAALDVIRIRREQRERDLLALVSRATSLAPYAALVREARCELGDVERLVRTEGVEGTLRTLLGHGIYLTVDEFKGRVPVRRGRLTLTTATDALVNRDAHGHVAGQTSGSRGERGRFPIGLEIIRDWAVNTCLDLDARGGGQWVHARWTVPGGEAIAGLLRFYLASGRPAARWFSPVPPDDAGVSPRYRWSGRALRWTAALSGLRFPRPEHVPPAEPRPIVDWVRRTLAAGATPFLVAYASSAVRIAQLAHELGLGLDGARFFATGEPLTRARLALIRRAGGEVIPQYSSMDVGPIGCGCLSPAEPDDVHLFDDLVAVVSSSADTLFFSSLRSAAPFVLLNVSLGDAATITSRRCGCPLEALGWGTHLEGIRSFEKLTAAGMTFLDTQVIQVLEEVLPARLGGGATDYQLVEDEGEDGRPLLRLLVHPGVGPVDPAAAAAVLLSALGEGSGAERIMARVWRDRGLVRVERRPPVAAPSGKVLHLVALRAPPRG